jgi:outer membrane protein
MKTLQRLAWVAGVTMLIALDASPTPAQEPVTLTLGGAARLAAARSAGPEAAGYRVDMAEARLRQQRADLLPSIAGVLSQGQRTLNSASFGLAIRDPATGADLFDPGGQVLGPVRSWDLRVAVRQSVVDFSAFGRVRAGRALVAAADAARDDASQQAAAAAATAYVRALRADALLSARQADSGLSEDLLDIARRQQQAGLSTSLDVMRARSRLAATVADLIAARAERERTALELRRALGIPLETPLTMTDSLAGMPSVLTAPSEAEASERALRMRADVRLVETQRYAVERQRAAIRAERLPVVALFADNGRTGTGIGRLLNTYSWGVQVSIPIFDGLRREGRMSEQQFAVRELEVRRRDLAQQVMLDVRVALLQLTSAGEQVAASDQTLALAEQELALARRRFTEGVAGNAEVVTASLSLSAARTQAVDARAALQSARVALARAQGVVTEMEER